MGSDGGEVRPLGVQEVGQFGFSPRRWLDTNPGMGRAFGALDRAFPERRKSIVEDGPLGCG
jgi:hypothetical protein